MVGTEGEDRDQGDSTDAAGPTTRPARPGGAAKPGLVVASDPLGALPGTVWPALHDPPRRHSAVRDALDPDDIREAFTAPPDVLHPGEGARILEPVVGTNSVILLDEGAHLEQRKLMLPAFHGEKMQALTGLVAEVTEREVAHWPLDEPIELHPRFQALTLEIILRAVFGLDPGPRLDGLRERLTAILAFGDRPTSLIPQLQLVSARVGPFKRFVELGRRPTR